MRAISGLEPRGVRVGRRGYATALQKETPADARSAGVLGPFEKGRSLAYRFLRRAFLRVAFFPPAFRRRAFLRVAFLEEAFFLRAAILGSPPCACLLQPTGCAPTVTDFENGTAALSREPHSQCSAPT